MAAAASCIDDDSGTVLGKNQSRRGDESRQGGASSCEQSIPSLYPRRIRGRGLSQVPVRVPAVRVGGSSAAAAEEYRATGPRRTSNDRRAPLPPSVPPWAAVDAEEQEWPPRPPAAHRSRDQVVTPRSLWIPAAGVVGRSGAAPDG
jgi:hypothetical protein